jgi:hypothetical protein
LWLKSTWSIISDGAQEVHTQIRQELEQRAPNTMRNFPSLAPKKVWEQQVLEAWLIDGLLLAYPTLSPLPLNKNEAIALILLATLSRNFDNQEYQNNICKIISGLIVYIGPNAVNDFPIKEFFSSCRGDSSNSKTNSDML